MGIHLPILRRLRSGGTSYTPISLFAAGEQGVWLDNSDFTTLFQDSAGTIPVTGYEQFVGLRLDKSKSGVGANGSKRVNLLSWTEAFDNAAWTKGRCTVSPNDQTAPDGTVTVDKFNCNETATGGFFAWRQNARATVPANTNIQASIVTKKGSRNQCRFDYYSDAAGGNGAFSYFNLDTGVLVSSGTFGSGVSIVGTPTITSIGSGYFRLSFVVTANTTEANLAIYPSITSSSDFSCISGVDFGYAWGADIRLAADAAVLPTYQRITDTWYNTIPGNHAYQTTTTARAVLSARYNLLTETEAFNAAVWLKPAGTTTINPNQATAPDGTTTADLVTATAGSACHYVAQNNSVSGSVTATIYAKSGTASWLGLGSGYTNGNETAWFNLTNGTVGTVVSGGSASIVDAGNGWWRCSHTRSSWTGGAILPFITNANNVSVFNAVGTETIYLWGADLRVANESSALPAYQRVGAAVNGTSTSIGTPDYDTVGFPAYLRYDGGDWMQTNSINFTATDKMSVFAGVRKLSDAAGGMIGELGNPTINPNGTFTLSCPGAPNYFFASSGTSRVTMQATGYVAPVTNILTGLCDISGDLATLRVNAIQGAQSTSDQGTGTFGNYPFYIGARGGTELFFTSREYGFVIVGRAVTASELTNTEDYMDVQTFGKNMTLVYSDELTTALGELITAADGDQIYMSVSYV